jgi:hypothetical protein
VAPIVRAASYDNPSRGHRACSSHTEHQKVPPPPQERTETEARRPREVWPPRRRVAVEHDSHP